MLDKPYRVQRCERITNGGGVVNSWAIMRTGAGVVCTTTDVSWAYLIVELLNADELQGPGKTSVSAQDG